MCLIGSVLTCQEVHLINSWPCFNLPILRKRNHVFFLHGTYALLPLILRFTMFVITVSNRTYRKESFHSKEYDTMMFTEFIFRLQSRHLSSYSNHC